MFRVAFLPVSGTLGLTMSVRPRHRLSFGVMMVACNLGIAGCDRFQREHSCASSNVGMRTDAILLNSAWFEVEKHPSKEVGMVSSGGAE